MEERVFIFKQYGKAIIRSKAWNPGVRDDIIKFDEVKDKPFIENLKIRTSAPAPAKGVITKLVIVYWDCFAEEGMKRPILGIKLAIDTGKHTPVCCKNHDNM